MFLFGNCEWIMGSRCAHVWTHQTTAINPGREIHPHTELCTLYSLGAHTHSYTYIKVYTAHNNLRVSKHIWWNIAIETHEHDVYSSCVLFHCLSRYFTITMMCRMCRCGAGDDRCVEEMVWCWFYVTVPCGLCTKCYRFEETQSLLHLSFICSWRSE